MEEALKNLGRALKLLLWLQLLYHGMFRLLFRFYAVVWALSAGLLVASFVMLFQQDAEAVSRYGPPWALVVECLLAIGLTYFVGRWVGSIPVIILAVVIPGTFVITPTVVPPTTTRGIEQLEQPEPVHIATGDLYLFAKGMSVCAVLVAFTFLVDACAQIPRAVVENQWRWPPRRALTCVLLVTGAVGLELLRLSVGLFPEFQPPWQPVMATLMVEPGWPYAICFWLWINIAHLLANYDTKLLPYLLHRVGQDGVPDRFSIHEAYLVDYLLSKLSEHRTGGSAHRGKVRRGAKNGAGY